MTILEREKIKKGIASYFHEIQVIKRIIRKHKTLSQHKFDEIFVNTYDKKTAYGELMIYYKSQTFESLEIKEDAFILGNFWDSIRDWSWWLDLTQHLIELGDVDSFMKDKILYYELPKSA